MAEDPFNEHSKPRAASKMTATTIITWLCHCRAFAMHIPNSVELQGFRMRLNLSVVFDMVEGYQSLSVTPMAFSKVCMVNMPANAMLRQASRDSQPNTEGLKSKV